MSDMKAIYLLVPLAPLAGAILAGLFGKQIGRAGAHVVTILGVAIAFVARCFIFQDVAGRQHLQRHRIYVDAGGVASTSRSVS
jgi:NADH-quinone oxidoreductase subunit L